MFFSRRLNTKVAVFSIFYLLLLLAVSSFFTWDLMFLSLIFSLYVAFLIFQYRLLPDFFYITLPYTFTQGTQLLSVAYLERGAFPSEIQTYTYYTGATLRLFVANAIFLFFSYLTYCHYRAIEKKDGCQKFRSIYRSLKKRTYLVYYTVVIFLIANMILFGAPLLNGTQRFIYWLDHPYGRVLSKLMGLTCYLGIFFGYLYKKSDLWDIKSKAKNYNLRMIIILFLLMIIYGNKFTWFLDFLFFFFLGVIAADGLYRKNYIVGGNFIFYCTSTLAIFLLILSSYILLHGYSFEEAFNLIFSRILELQGQVYWAIDRLVMVDNIGGNFSDLLTIKTEFEPGGIFLLMNLIAPSSVFETYIKARTPFSSGFPAISIYSLGYYWSLIFQIFVGYLWITVSVILLNDIKRGRFFQSWLMIIFYILMIWAFTLGSVYVFATPMGLTFSLYLFIRILLFYLQLSKKVHWILSND